MVGMQINIKVGASVRCKVLEVDLERQRAVLTLKKKLLQSKLPIIASYEDAAAAIAVPDSALVSHGFVTAVKPGKGLIVTFYNNVHGIVTEAELARAVSA